MSGVLPEHMATDHGHIPARDGRHAFGIEFMLRRMNPGVQTGWDILVQHRDGLLADDGARIHPRVHKMDGAACHFHAMLKRLPPGFKSGKRREQRRMNIHNPALKRAEKIAFQNAHETGEHD